MEAGVFEMPPHVGECLSCSGWKRVLHLERERQVLQQAPDVVGSKPDTFEVEGGDGPPQGFTFVEQFRAGFALGLLPDREWFYRFRYRDDVSPVGRTRTAPLLGAGSLT